MNYFSITAGRTGSAWLASFLSSNLQIDEIHEPLGINDFGEKMPDIRTMRNFNNFGNNKFVKDFWQRKFKSIPTGVYAETNHTLSKCGLVENTILHDRAENTTLIVLRRDIVDQCVSYLVRNDFVNITTLWQWYLHPSYQLKIINPSSFDKFDGLSLPLWYCYEMAARQEYYIQRFSNEIKMVEITLEVVTKNEGAKQFWNELGLMGNCKMPPIKNANKSQPNAQLINKVREITDSINVDMKDLVHNAIKSGFSF